MNVHGSGFFGLSVLLLLPALAAAQTPAVEVESSTGKTLMQLNTNNGFVLYGQIQIVPPSPIPVEGAGTRLMWHPAKAAFRAGHVTGEDWDDVNVGDFSVAMGEGTEATGDWSTALGRETRASNFSATAMGTFTEASGASSTAMGASTTASGNNSTAMGNLTTAQALGSLVIGRWNIVSGSADTWVDTDPLFVAGNGDLGSPSNALTLLKNGNLTLAGQIESESGGFKFPDGTEQTTAALNRWSPSGNDVFRISGNVGIGTSAPDARLHVRGSIGLGDQLILDGSETTGAAGTGGGLLFQGHNGFTPQAWASIRGLKENGTDGSTAAYLAFATRPDGGAVTERLRITSEGNVGIGTDAPDQALTVFDGDGTGGTALNLVAFSPSPRELRIGVNQSSGGFISMQTANDLDFRTNGVKRMVIESSGDVGIGTTNPTARLEVNGVVKALGFSNTSDARLKRNVSEIEDALGLVSRLRGVRYVWDASADPERRFESGRRLGFLAQEVKAVLPEVVREDASGYLSVGYQEVVPVLVEAIKQQQAEIDALKARLARLEAQREPTPAGAQ